MPEQIARELVLDSPIGAVWEAITDPGRLGEWLGEVIELALTPGGDARFVVDGELRDGWVEEVLAPSGERPARLAFWWQAGDEPASRVSFELTPSPRGTRLRVCETRPLEVLDLVGVPLRGAGGVTGGPTYGPALVAAAG